MLKQVQPVIAQSKEPVGRLTEKTTTRKLRLRERSEEVAEHISAAGGRMLVADLERQIRRGLLGLLKVFRRNNITIRGFLKLYTELFTTRNGYVTLKTTAPTSTPAPEPTLAEQIEKSDARNAMLKANKKEAAKERLESLSKVYRG